MQPIPIQTYSFPSQHTLVISLDGVNLELTGHMDSSVSISGLSSDPEIEIGIITLKGEQTIQLKLSTPINADRSNTSITVTIPNDSLARARPLETKACILLRDLDIDPRLEEHMKNEDIKQAIFSGDAATVAQGVRENLDAGQDPGDVLNQALVPPMIEVGDQYERGEVYVPEMLIAAHAMKAGMEILRPELVKAGVQPLGKIGLGTVQGDIHDIGKNLVGMMLEGAGFEVLDLGIDVSTDKFIEAVKNGLDILAMSGLLTTTIPAMPEVIQALNAAGVRDQVKIMVGGAPVTEAFKQEIGADGYAPDAASAVRIAKDLIA